jgi:hypothetical protein
MIHRHKAPGWDNPALPLLFSRFLHKETFISPDKTRKKSLKFKDFLRFNMNFILVGVAGLEPAASWSRTMRDTKLRHTPICIVRVFQRGWSLLLLTRR